MSTDALTGELAAHLGRPEVIRPADSTSHAVEVREAINSLSPGDQTIVTLNAWEDLSSPEIADVLGMNPSTVRVRLLRARARLREQPGVPGYGGDLPTVATS